MFCFKRTEEKNYSVKNRGKLDGILFTTTPDEVKVVAKEVR